MSNIHKLRAEWKVWFWTSHQPSVKITQNSNKSPQILYKYYKKTNSSYYSHQIMTLCIFSYITLAHLNFLNIHEEINIPVHMWHIAKMSQTVLCASSKRIVLFMCYCCSLCVCVCNESRRTGIMLEALQKNITHKWRDRARLLFYV